MKENGMIGAEIEKTAEENESSALEVTVTESNIEETALNEEDIDGSEEGETFNDRDEYERLIKTRFKDYYAEDTQRMINRRFRKYKVLEEKCKVIEQLLSEKEAKLKENDQTIADFEERLQKEIEKVAADTERRVLEAIKSKRMRPSENGVSPHYAQAAFDVSRLTKSERAGIAKRAANGEKISF